MKLMIPSLGSRIKLTKDFVITLHQSQYCNRSMNKFIPKEFQLWDLNKANRDRYKFQPKQDKYSLTIPKGAVLELCVVQLRRKRAEQDKVSFELISSGLPLLNPELSRSGKPSRAKSGRFYIPLAEANNLEFEWEI